VWVVLLLQERVTADARQPRCLLLGLMVMVVVYLGLAVLLGGRRSDQASHCSQVSVCSQYACRALLLALLSSAQGYY